jgi:transcriptional regulator with XRE-family HTH domain
VNVRYTDAHRTGCPPHYCAINYANNEINATNFMDQVKHARHPGGMSDQLARLAAMVRAGRKAKDLTQEQLAAVTGVSSESISNIERGKFAPTFEVLAALVKSLELDVKAIFATARQNKKTTAQRLNDEAGIAQIIRDLEDRQVGLLFDIAKAVRDRPDRDDRSNERRQ